MAFSYKFFVVIFVVIFCEFSGAQPEPGKAGCVNGEVAQGEFGVCGRHYLLCESGVWRKAMCVGSVFNVTSSRCVPYSATCPDLGLVERAINFRQKRAALDCSRSFACPSDLNNLFIYPDWSNTACDTYIVCAGGTLQVNSCATDGYKYYNPRRLSCEEADSIYNTCLHRLETDVTPLFQ